MKKIIFPALLALLAAVPHDAAAIELLLESNKGESGTIGYVDIDRVFKEYSGTSGARDEFVAAIKKKEDEVTAKKTAIFTIKAEMAKLRQEREFALTLPSLLETKQSVLDAEKETALREAAVRAAAKEVSAKEAAAKEAAAKAAAAAAQISTAAPSGPGVQTSTAAAQISTAPLSVAVPQAAPAETKKETPPAATPEFLPLPGVEGIEMPGVGKVSVNHFKFSISTSVPEIDAALGKKENELNAKEEELRVFQKQAEKELLDYESRKNEMLLGRIYVALKELAQKEEVSVVIDKRNILYGQNAVDLTDKLIERLEESGL